ncbi:MAG: sulfite exporter TauE/SafE family protein [Ignavibacteriae bacterium]|nr:sulfite exporter TauE/SafE family protein [Ignavibacteriota bacterium]
MEVWAGLILGFVGSFHCAGMCGPIAMALPGSGYKDFKFIFGRLIYNSGRVITYALMGALFGFLGNRIAISGLQQELSIVLGILILISLSFYFLGSKNKYSAKLLTKYTSIIKKPLATLFKKKSYFSLLLIGVINGLLPCGFVYIAIAGSLSTGGVTSGILFMTLFGLGTFPIMLSASVFGNIIRNKIRIPYAKILPSLSVVIAILLILRGLNLGIPYISPELKSTPQDSEVICK